MLVPMIQNDKILEAVSALKQLHEKDGSSKAADRLFEESEKGNLFLHVTMKKIPFLNHLTVMKIALPYPFKTDCKDVCLFTSDLNKKKADDEQTVNHISQLLKSNGISVGQIIPFHQLRTEYKTHEARRHLSKAYDVFVAEGSICKMLPVALGRSFVSKRKMPISVSLRPDKLKSEFRRVLSKTTLTLTGRGSSCIVKVGTIGDSADNLLGNVQAAVAHLEKHLPGKWENIRSLHLKLSLSISLPIYVSLGSANLVMLPKGESSVEPVAEEMDALTRSKVKVYPSGKVKLVKDLPDDIDNEMTLAEKKLLARQRQKKNKMRTIHDKLAKRRTLKFDKTKLKQDKSFEDSFRVQSLKSKPMQLKQIFENSLVKRTDLPKKKQLHLKKDKDVIGKRLRLSTSSLKRSYSMAAKRTPGKQNESAELLNYIKKEFPGSSPTSQTQVQGSRKMKRGRSEKSVAEVKKSKIQKNKNVSEKKLSRIESLRQSVRLAKSFL